MRYLLSLVLLVACIVWGSTASAQPVSPPAVVTGRVVDADGQALPYASVRIDGTVAGAATDSTGRFRFTTRRSERVTLRASMVGYADDTQSVMLAPGDTTSVRFQLSPRDIELNEALVTEAHFTTGTDAQASLSTLEAVTTPGASGDVLRGLQAFPGVAAPGDGAGLFVRGGDVSETQTLLDGAPLAHPYRYESPSGGSFSTVPTFLVDGTQFATGGFSAKYGNALSGVLSIETLDRPQAAQQRINVGLAGVGLRIDQPIVYDALGLRVSGNRSFTGLLFRVNGQNDDFDTVPQGWDGTASLTWDHDRLGQLKAQSFVRKSRLGVQTQEGAFVGRYRTEATNQLHSLHWETSASDWTVESSLSWSRFASERSFGVLDLCPIDRATTLRVDATHRGLPQFERGRWRAGAIVQRRTYEIRGTVPVQPDVLTPGAPTNTFREALTVRRAGGYLDADVPIGPRLTATVGLRADHHSDAGTVADPRAALAMQLGGSTTLRAAWGRYHQFPEPSTLGEHSGPNALGAEQAQHLVLGLQHDRGPWLARIAGYWKPYRDLVVRTGSATFANEGTGHARGADAFLRYGAFLETPISGWISYSLLDAERTQPRDVGSVVQLDDGPAPFDLTHQLSVVGKAEVLPRVYLGGTYRVTSGRPFTPVVDTEPTASDALLPIDGPVGSMRLPPYQRLDMQVSYFWPFGNQQHAIVYAAINNLLDRANATGVNYTADYSNRSLRTTNFRRSFYIGVRVQL
ncbi:hypothetical protein CRI93_12650 [Longimonas halophila]|uniref:TonB-dependent receptor n=1 Tax=Longimonas halophila TaxID=1469170 RepID=A0A2H3NQP1_9BACT|nr:TonB-dependent receptor [Longimonas halophila]PEN05540.1 hypothetical protein CRI93_12650 [Longimonas halophila]